MKKAELHSHRQIELLRKSCDLCSGHKFIVLFRERKPKERLGYRITDASYGFHPQIVQCVDCGLIFGYPLDKQEEILELYDSFEDPEYEKERKARGENQRKILSKINTFFPKKGKILDIGCATGIFLELARNDGWDVMGVEPSKWASDIARREYKLPVYYGTLEEAKIPDKSFDVVVCLDVIEHVSSPRRMVAGIKRVLKPNGLLCIVTPDVKSIVARILGEKWWHIRPDHIFLFSRETLSYLLLSEGFEIEVVSRYGWRFSYDYWTSRLKDNIPFIYKVTQFLKKVPIVKSVTSKSYTMNFGDSLELYCRMVKKMGFLISFSGIDGASKSTQVKLLEDYLRKKGKKVYATEEMFGYYLLRPFIKALRVATGSPAAGPVKINTNPLPKLWFILAFIDMWFMFIFKIRPLLMRYDFVLADRFYTDIWANLAYYGYLPSWAFGFFAKLLPKPGKAFLLWVKPQVGQKRSSEFSLSYFTKQASIYKRLSDIIDFHIFDANQAQKLLFWKIAGEVNKND